MIYFSCKFCCYIFVYEITQKQKLSNKISHSSLVTRKRELVIINDNDNNSFFPLFPLSDDCNSRSINFTQIITVNLVSICLNPLKSRIVNFILKYFQWKRFYLVYKKLKNLTIHHLQCWDNSIVSDCIAYLRHTLLMVYESSFNSFHSSRSHLRLSQKQYLDYFPVLTLRCWLQVGCHKNWCPSCHCGLESWRELGSGWDSWGHCRGLQQYLQLASKWCPTKWQIEVSISPGTKGQTQWSIRCERLTWLLCGVPYRASTRSAALFNSIS